MFSVTRDRVPEKGYPRMGTLDRVPAAQGPTNLRPFKDFLIPKFKKFKTNFSIQKTRKGNPLRGNNANQNFPC